MKYILFIFSFLILIGSCNPVNDKSIDLYLEDSSSILREGKSLSEVIREFQKNANIIADEHVYITGSNIEEFLKLVKDYKYCVIIVEDYTIVKITDLNRTQMSGSWKVDMPYGEGYTKQNSTELEKNYINFMIGKVDTRKRVAYLFNKKIGEDSNYQEVKKSDVFDTLYVNNYKGCEIKLDPNEKSKTLTSLDYGDTLHIVEVIKDWYGVLHGESSSDLKSNSFHSSKKYRKAYVSRKELGREPYKLSIGKFIDKSISYDSDSEFFTMLDNSDPRLENNLLKSKVINEYKVNRIDNQIKMSGILQVNSAYPDIPFFRNLQRSPIIEEYNSSLPPTVYRFIYGDINLKIVIYLTGEVTKMVFAILNNEVYLLSLNACEYQAMDIDNIDIWAFDNNIYFSPGAFKTSCCECGYSESVFYKINSNISLSLIKTFDEGHKFSSDDMIVKKQSEKYFDISFDKNIYYYCFINLNKNFRDNNSSKSYYSISLIQSDIFGTSDGMPNLETESTLLKEVDGLKTYYETEIMNKDRKVKSSYINDNYFRIEAFNNEYPHIIIVGKLGHKYYTKFTFMYTESEFEKSHELINKHLNFNSL